MSEEETDDLKIRERVEAILKRDPTLGFSDLVDALEDLGSTLYDTGYDDGYEDGSSDNE